MKWKDFFQIIILFSLFLAGIIYAILKFQQNGMDTTFLISFILATLTIVLSIYYSEKTNNIFNQITEKIQSISDENKGVCDKITSLEGKINKYEEHNKNGGNKEDGK